MPKKDRFFSDSDDEQTYEPIELLELIKDNDEIGVTECIENHECDVNEHDLYDNYPVTKAASNNNFVILRLLFEAGAKFDVVDGFGKSPLDYAKKNENTDMEVYIRECIRAQKPLSLN